MTTKALSPRSLLLKASKENKQALASEVIAFQNDNTFQTLTKFCQEMFDTVDKNKVSNKAREIEAFILKRFGISIELVYDQGLASVIVPHVVCNPVLVSFIQNQQHSDLFVTTGQKVKEYLDLNGIKRGSIDLKNAKVSGFYSTINFRVYINFNLFKNAGFEPDMVAALFLHEIGHAFFSLEFMFRTHRASAILSALHQSKTGRTDDLVYSDVIDLCGNVVKKEELVSDYKEYVVACEIKDDTVRRNVIYSLFWQKLSIDFGTDSSKSADFENLADMFAVRFGAGEALTRALFAYDNGGDMAYGKTSKICDYFLAATGVIFLVGIPLLLLNILFSSNKPDNNGIGWTEAYASPRERYSKVRKSIVANLKISTLSKEERSTLVKQIEAIDKLLQNYSDYSKISDRIVTFIYKERRDRATAIKLESDLESLANNDLFLAASRLRINL